MNPRYDFAGQAALVTGAPCGHGRALAKAFSEDLNRSYLGVPGGQYR